MTKRRMKDMLKQEAEMTTRQADLIKQLYTERDSLVRQAEDLKKEIKLLLAQCADLQKLALTLAME